jgi:hypothetical protein
MMMLTKIWLSYCSAYATGLGAQSGSIQPAGAHIITPVLAESLRVSIYLALLPMSPLTGLRQKKFTDG